MGNDGERGRRPDAGAQTFARGLDVLAAVVDSERPLSVTEVARATGLSRSIAYRLLRTLEDRGMVVQADGRGYRAGLGLLRLMPRQRQALTELARPALVTLAQRTGATAVLSVRDRDQEVVALCVLPVGDGPAISMREGAAGPLGCGAASLALLALDPPTADDRPEVTAARALGEGAVVRQTGELRTGTTALALAWRGEPDLALSAVFFTGTVEEEDTAAALVETARVLAGRT